MELKYIKNETGNPTIYLIDDIGGMSGINGAEVVQEINFIESIGATDLDIRINSSGGSIMDGFNIIAKLLDTKLNTTAYIDGVAASIAGIIALAANKVVIADFGMVMIHEPSFPVQNSKDQEILDMFKSSLLKILTNRTGISLAELTEIMNKESWFNAEAAKTIGLADEIYTTEREFFTNHLQGMYNSLIKINQTDMKDIKNEVIEEVLEVEVETTETTEDVVEITEDVVDEVEVETEEVDPLQAQIDSLIEENKQLKADLDNFKEVENKKIEEDIHSILEPIKNDISTEDYDKWFDLGKTDIEFVKNSIQKISKPTNIKSVNVELVKEDTPDTIDIRKMEKENPTKLAEIFNNDIELYKRSFKKAYNVEYNTEG